MSAMSAWDFLTTIVAGHGYDVGSNSSGESDGQGEIAGLSMTWILAAGAIGLFTAGLLVWINPEAQARIARVRWKAVAPKVVIVLIIAAPLVAWTASSGGDEKPENLRVQRETALTGEPELLVSLGEDDLNTLETTRGKEKVRVVCVGRGGEVVVDVARKWPFVNERGYDYPHTHLVISRAQVQQAQRCRLRGTAIPLAADVEGRLPR